MNVKRRTRMQFRAYNKKMLHLELGMVKPVFTAEQIEAMTPQQKAFYEKTLATYLKHHGKKRVR